MNKSHRFYREGLRFECTCCGACCRTPGGSVKVNDREIRELTGSLQISVSDFLLKYCDNPGREVRLKEQSGGACIFLKNDRCSVYEARPLQCRTYPFWPENLKSPYRWKMVAEECPGVNHGKLHPLEDIQKMLLEQNSRDASEEPGSG